jgi:hypothetical protein
VSVLNSRGSYDARMDAMFEKNGKYYADWRDRTGRRLRKAFTSERAALIHEEAE